MHEDSKIKEAEYFLKGIAVAGDDPNATRYQTSAFLTAARSVLQYARDEAMSKPGGQAWYDDAVVSDPVVKFLKDHRDINVHERPLPMRTNITFYPAAGEIRLSSTSATLVHSRSAGDSPDTESLAGSGVVPETPTAALRPPSYDYRFKGWPGSEDVPTLSARYLFEIKRIVADGRQRGFLTP